MLDLRRLQVLHRFSVCGSITATASSLGYSPSAISQQLATLERESGAVLVERTARSANLTDAGRLLADHAALLLAAVETAEADLAAQVGSISGHLVVSAIPSLAAGVAAALADVQRRHPRLDIVMKETISKPAITAVADHLSDIAVVDDWYTRPHAAPAGLSRRPIHTEAVVLAVSASHPLAGTAGPLGGRELAAAVAEMTWLCAPLGHASRAAGDRRLADLRAVPRRRWEFEGLITIAELIAGDTGCALLPETIAATQPRGSVHTVALSPRMVRHAHAYIRSSTATSPSTALCLRAITEHLRTTGPAAAGGRS